MHTHFYIETAGGKRKCRALCGEDIQKGEKCLVENYSDGMYDRKDNYHLKCGMIFLDTIIEDLTKLKEDILKNLG